MVSKISPSFGKPEEYRVCNCYPYKTLKMENLASKWSIIFCALLYCKYQKGTFVSANTNILSPTQIDVVVTYHSYCPPGEVIVIHDFEWDCVTVAEGEGWTPFIYDYNEGTGEVNRNRNVRLESVSEDIACGSTSENDVEHLKLVQFANQPDPDCILLSNGSLMWRSDECTCGKCRHWRHLNASFYIDARGYPASFENGSVATAYYSERESDQVFLYCQQDLRSNQKVTSAWSTIDKVFVVVLVLTTLSYLVTTFMYGLLWGTYNLPGRTVFSVVLSRTFLSFLSCLSFLGSLYRWDITLHSWCAFIGVSSHYFLLAAYAWVTILNFDFWQTFTFKSLQSPVHKDISTLNRKYAAYSCFAWGVPFILVLSSFLVDAVYRYSIAMISKISKFDKVLLLLLRFRDDTSVDWRFVPNYGNGICFIVECARGIYVHAFSAFFLLPAFVLAVLTFHALFQFRRDTSSIRNAKHGEDTARWLRISKF